MLQIFLHQVEPEVLTQVELLAPEHKRKLLIEKTSLGKVSVLRHAAQLREGMS